jgi:nucleotide-binding universal stress UspA family protein
MSQRQRAMSESQVKEVARSRSWSSPTPWPTALLEGDPAQTLSEQSEHLDLLVPGSRGYGPLRSVLLGSVSAQVFRESRVRPWSSTRRRRGDHVQPDP